MKKILSVVLLIALTSCASMQQPRVRDNEAERIQQETLAAAKPLHEAVPEIPALNIPEFVPVREGVSPLSNRKVTISARNTPLRDVLSIVAETANLNLVMERGINPELPVTASFTDITVEDALNILFDSLDYFYAIKDNILIVKALDTKIFEFGQPNVIQEYKTSVGGDILSGISSGGGSDSVNGAVSVSTVSDKTSYEFWNIMEQTLKRLMNLDETSTAGPMQPGFIINRMTGTIMVTAVKRDLKKVSEYIETIKKILNRQVVIEARIVEVQLSDGLKYGIDWEAVGKWLGVGTTTLATKGFTDVIRLADPHFEFAVTENDNLSLVLKALKEQGDLNILSNPRVNIMNGQTSVLSVGRNTTFISRVETTTTTSAGSAPVTTFSVETNSILSGMIFGLVPYINNEGEITLTITPILSNLIDLEAKTIGTGTDSVEIQLPVVDLRELSTTVKVMDGQMVIIGGLIDKIERSTEDKVPLLGDIPLLGRAFKRVEKTYDNKELVIMLIPRIVS